ncbi:hypothetical protein RUMOBE_02648 [Blautia obeum ATCC 29174]|uniref:Uncharacterized protein n=1 Tax=Blautia obeum ATCC 29174 TaxID=411459 RepID=A5ZUG3_9FIRM|nr:hypothetical protein RUMOBE_02648 [Blautia obeum ATCC 29174]
MKNRQKQRILIVSEIKQKQMIKEIHKYKTEVHL